MKFSSREYKPGRCNPEWEYLIIAPIATYQLLFATNVFVQKDRAF